MDSEFVNLLKVVAYLVVGTAGIVMLAGWALKRFGPPKKKRDSQDSGVAFLS